MAKTAGLKVNVNVSMEGLKNELKIVHKHIGTMLEELENICPDCGFDEITETTLYQNDKILRKSKECNKCGCAWHEEV